MAKRKNIDPDEPDSRGRRKGQRGARKGTTAQPHGGAIGQEPYEPTDKDREYVREYVWHIGQGNTAKKLGISVRTLQRHFRKQMDEAEIDLEEKLSRKAVVRALDEDDGATLRFILANRFSERWSNKVTHEHGGVGGGPIQTVDISDLVEGKSIEELKALERFFEKIAERASGSESDGGEGRGAESSGDVAAT